MQKKTSNEFCLDILKFGISKGRALANLVMSLASYTQARSVVELSLSPLYHYQYSSLRDAIDSLAKDAAKRSEMQEKFRQYYWHYGSGQSTCQGPVVLQTDTTPVRKAHSPTLKDRQYISVPNNVISGNKPLDIGYEFSFVNLSGATDKWSLPLDIQRLEPQHTAASCAHEQLKNLLNDEELGLLDRLVINCADSSYGTCPFLAPLYEEGNLINLVRIKSGRKVWVSDYRTDTGGGPRYYGKKLYLHRYSINKHYKRHPKTKEAYTVFQPSIFERPADEEYAYEEQTATGRSLIVQLWRWNNMLLRSRSGHNMRDKPIDIIAIRVQDAQTWEYLFKHDLFLAVSGQNKAQLPTKKARQYYRRRYDIEPYLRFAKQRLLIDKYQTPDVEHLENWFLIVAMASWLLYVAAEEVQLQVHEWEKYLPQNRPKSKTDKLYSMAQTRRATQTLFLTFDQQPFTPPKCKGGPGRQKGTKLSQRTRYKVNKKTHKKPITQKIE